MLSLQDCLDYSGIPEETIAAIAEHEQVPEIVAAEIGCTLLASRQGIYRIRQFLRENIAHARELGQTAKARQLDHAFRDFEKAYPLHASPASQHAASQL
ncbi:MAG: hypothetical protein PHU46_10135 [Rhodocyclaceae bacterium]|nr:hypothetical protein [Rhodocyclaceae bacterium]